MLKRYLIPDRMVERYSDVTPELLRDLGIRALLIDIDNTLAPYEQPEPDDALRVWLASLSRAGIRAALISNNDRARVERFNRTLGLVAHHKSGKPFGRVIRRVMRDFDVAPHEAAMLGDQLLTDALAGKRLGLFTLIVPPIRDKRTPFVRFKRWLERPYIRAYRQKHGEGEQGRD